MRARPLRLALLAALGGVAATEAAEHPAVCEVEIAGTVRVPRKFKKAPPPLTFVAIGDCLAPSPQIVGFGGSTFGRFFVEVFVPWGSDLTICAASESKPGGPSTLYGKAALVMHAEKGGEVEFHDVKIDVAPGPPRTFEHYSGPPRQPAGGAAR